MEAFLDLLAFITSVPAMAGLILTGSTIFLTSDWRLALTALLVQYVLAGLTLARFIQAEVAVVKILAGILAVFILYLTARRIQEMEVPQEPQQAQKSTPRPLRQRVGWTAGPFGLALRLLAIVLVGLALIRLFDDPRLPLTGLSTLFTVPDVAFVACWLGGMGLVGLILSSDPLRVAPALLTILTGFDLVYARLEPSLAIAGFFGALTLLATLAFSYLATVQGFSISSAGPGEEETEP